MFLANKVSINKPLWVQSILVGAFRGLIILGALLLPMDPAKSAKDPEKQEVTTLDFQRNFCKAQTTAHERALGLPANLLTSISIAESGRWDAQRSAMFAWPWTVMAKGKGRYLPTMAAAIAEVNSLKAEGVKNIDVGCMQINLHYHPNAFKDLKEAFEPASNVNYASRFLQGLQAATQSWPQAAANYHSTNPRRNQPYLNKVLGIWQKISNRSIRSSGFKLSPDPAYSEPTSRIAQLAVLNSRFRARLAAERTAPKPKKRETQIESWRRGRFEGLNLADQAARGKANRARLRKQEISQPKSSFADRRQRQIAEWRKRRDGSVFR